MYWSQLAIEALVVGAVTVAGFMLIQQVLPKYSMLVQLYVTGLAIHLSFEAVGANKWYLKHGAATLV
jgi:hypothetical protein